MIGLQKDLLKHCIPIEKQIYQNSKDQNQGSVTENDDVQPRSKKQKSNDPVDESTMRNRNAICTWRGLESRFVTLIKASTTTTVLYEQATRL